VRWFWHQVVRKDLETVEGSMVWEPTRAMVVKRVVRVRERILTGRISTCG